MLKLIKNVHVYAPENLGVKDVLFSANKIIAIEDNITINADFVEVFERKGFLLVPGFIDSHVHLTGGGGESGPASRVPEIQLEDFIKAGITTCIGLLGTDGFTRNMANLLSKVNGLRQSGFNAYALSGSYQLPLKTFTDSIEEDLLYCDPVIGIGEIAISDHRSALPTQTLFNQTLRRAYLGGMLAGKAGVSVIHIGSDDTMLEYIINAVKSNVVPAKYILPTHINRSHELLIESAQYSKTYKAPLDITTYPGKTADLAAYKSVIYLLQQGVDPDLITLSSDGQGSLPKYNDKKELVGLDVGKVSTLHEHFTYLVNDTNQSIEQSLAFVGKNVAARFKLKTKGQIKVGYDADLIILDKELKLCDVFINGHTAMHKKTLKLTSLFSQ